MTLAQWAETFPYKVMPHSSGCMTVAAVINHPQYRALFNLEDYAVSSVEAGTVWLVPKRTPKKCSSCGELRQDTEVYAENSETGEQIFMCPGCVESL